MIDNGTPPNLRLPWPLSQRRGAYTLLVRDDEDMILLDRYTDVRQAEFALSILEGSDIDGFVDVPYTSSMFPHLAFSAGVSLFVRTEDQERAREVLANLESDSGG